MCARFKRIGGELFGPHLRLFLKMTQTCFTAYLRTFLFNFFTIILTQNILESLSTFYFLSVSIQWCSSGVYAATDALITWLDLPLPWPDELHYHRYPHHHRKFGLYYKAPAHATASATFNRVLFSLVLLGAHHLLTPIEPLHLDLYTSGWESTPPSHAVPTIQPVSPSLLTDFLTDTNPSKIVRLLTFTSPGTTHNHQKEIFPTSSFFTILDNPSCFTTPADVNTILIIDTGAPVCVTPHRHEFVTYHLSSMKIKDLSHSNSVAGEGYVSWTITDSNETAVLVRLPACHIPGINVRLLSPQILLRHFGGTLTQTTNAVSIALDSGTTFTVPYCPRSNLPYLPTPSPSSLACFWSTTFDYSTLQTPAICTSLLQQSNTNLTAAQKDVLKWHYHLLHAGMQWVQMLMRDRA